jgi:hypothetical protein
MNQLISRDGGRGVANSAILKTLRDSGSRATVQLNGTLKIASKEATIVLNAAGKIVTVAGKAKASAPVGE